MACLPACLPACLRLPPPPPLPTYPSQPASQLSLLHVPSSIASAVVQPPASITAPAAMPAVVNITYVFKHSCLGTLQTLYHHTVHRACTHALTHLRTRQSD
ncbi:hypothetical protein CGMCC3_g11108 [Colletotrichum fructicola]|nr:uncharacterized protein CGMCC3_g11108 [Colletotrichum fructicola]KAE9572930.1 hypothetical protein CGMCC3_g11108 [Colletotrichum fructicola]